jgi:hypothetical protein
MLIDDERNVSCGGDPFNFLKSVMKGIFIQLDQGQDALVMIMKEKYPYDRGIFEALASNAKLEFLDLQVKGDEFHVLLRKPLMAKA